MSFSGAVNTSLNTASMGDFSGQAFEYGGDYSVGYLDIPRETLSYTVVPDLEIP